MALRLMNTGKHPLTVDLRGGASLVLAPGETSPPLREEGLYGHPYLSAWVAGGVVQRLPARMDDVLEHEAALGLPGPAVVQDEDGADDDGADDDGAEAAASAEAGEGAIGFVPDEALVAGLDAGAAAPEPRPSGRGRGRGSRRSR